VTPWLPIAVTLLVTFGAAFLVWRLTRNGALATSAALFVLALASFALGTIATIAYFWGGLLLLGALVAAGVSRVS
jgi:hypothetical protein